nr:hypothetical protein [Tanacetum cinerariifolium]
MSIEIRKKEKPQQLEQWANLITYPSKRFNSFFYDDDDDEDYTLAVTPSFPIEEPDNSLSMGDEHLDTILATYPYDSSSLPQQYLCCARCGGPHETCQCDQLIFDEPYCKHCGGPHMNYQCQLMNQDSYNSNSLGFDQPQPPQSPVIHQPPQELKEQWAYLSTHPSKRLHSLCFDDDDDEDYTLAITPDAPVLSTEEPDNSLSMGDEHLDSISATESDEFIKSGVENLIPIL